MFKARSDCVHRRPGIKACKPVTSSWFELRESFSRIKWLFKTRDIRSANWSHRILWDKSSSFKLISPQRNSRNTSMSWSVRSFLERFNFSRVRFFLSISPILETAFRPSIFPDKSSSLTEKFPSNPSAMALPPSFPRRLFARNKLTTVEEDRSSVAISYALIGPSTHPFRSSSLSNRCCLKYSNGFDLPFSASITVAITLVSFSISFSRLPFEVEFSVKSFCECLFFESFSILREFSASKTLLCAPKSNREWLVTLGES